MLKIKILKYERFNNYDFQKIDKNKFKEKNYIKHVRK
jgi:hypothetical protein